LTHNRKKLAALDREINAVEYRNFQLADVVTLSGVYDLHGWSFILPRFGVVVGDVVVHVVYLLLFRLVD